MWYNSTRNVTGALEIRVLHWHLVMRSAHHCPEFFERAIDSEARMPRQFKILTRRASRRGSDSATRRVISLLTWEDL